jgi:hypothetical protein
MSGVQLAGFSNITAGDSSNVQAAGFFNYSKNTKGCQAAGFMNVTAKKMEGVQMAGFLNYASEMNGFQIGIVNLSAQSNGIPIGLFSFVGNGFHKIEASYNDVLPINLAFKTGVKQFYNIFSAGYNSNPSKEYFSYGYGIGHEFTINKKIGLDVELVSNQMNWKRWDELNLWNKANINLAWNIAPHFGLIAGPNLNFAITEKFRPQATEVSAKNFIPENAFEVKNNSKNYITKGWIGFNVGLRFW